MTPIARLLTPKVPLWRYSLEAWPYALIPSITLAAIAAAVVSVVGIPIESVVPTRDDLSLRSAFGAVVLAPVIETCLLALGLRLLSKFVDRPIFAATISAVMWGLLHGLFGTLWFFGTAWSFFVFSCGFIAWRSQSFKAGFIAAAVPHALVNVSAILLGALDAA
jgi:hypothetical protein